MRNAIVLWFVCLASGAAAVCLGAGPQSSADSAPLKASVDSQASGATTQAYLGVRVEPTHQSLVRHLMHLLRDNQGALVVHVAAGSPADTAGIREDDIVVKYNGQKLHGPQQLINLIHDDKPGNEATLGIIRAGEPQQIAVKLGEYRMAASGPQQRRAFKPIASQPEVDARSTEEQQAVWLNFDSMTLARENNNKFKAEIKYRDDQGKIETRAFEGTREELRKDIDAEKNLPTTEREHLLRALDLARHPFRLSLPAAEP